MAKKVKLETTDSESVVVKVKKTAVSTTFRKLMEKNKCSTPEEYRKLRRTKLKLQRKSNWNNVAPK